MLFTTRIISDRDTLFHFQHKYKIVSGLDIPKSYLLTRKVYGVYQRDVLIGGFIIGDLTPFRTLKVFASEEAGSELISKFNRIKCIELTCVWGEKSKMNAFLGSLYWLEIGRIIQMQKAEMVLFGTNKEGLKKNIYDLLIKTRIVSNEHINGINNYVYISVRKYMLLAILLGIPQRILYKLKKNFLKKKVNPSTKRIIQNI